MKYKTLKVGEIMYKTMKEFASDHPHAVIVNYDMANIFDSGLVYRTSKGSLERVHKQNSKYINYPYIQQYQKGTEVQVELFIIHNGEMHKIERIIKNDNESNYRKTDKIEIDPLFIKDDVFYIAPKSPKVINEPLLKIEEI